MAKTKAKASKVKAGKAAVKPKAAKPAKPAKAPAHGAKPAKGAPAKPLSNKAMKTVPAKAIRPVSSLYPPPPPAPPPPPPPPPPRDELAAPRDIGRLTRYGERFGPHKIDVRTAMRSDVPTLPLQLPASSGQLALLDPAVPKSLRVLDRPIGAGQFRVMLSIARTDDNKERLAAIVIHVGRPPIAKWTVAHFKGQKKPKSADVLPRVPVTSGWIALIDAGEPPGVLAVPSTASGLAPVEIPLTDGRRALALPCGEGEFAAYWAVDAMDKPICLVVDFEAFTQKEWKARPA